MVKLNKILILISCVLWHGFLVIVIIDQIFNIWNRPLSMLTIILFCIFGPYSALSLYAEFFYKEREKQ